MANKVAITTTSFAKFDRNPVDQLEKEKFEIVFNQLGRKLTGDEIVNICQGCVGIVAGTEKYSADVLEKLSGLKVISRCGVGMDNVDRAACEKLGIKVVNTPYGPTLAVAELVVGLLFSMLRKIPQMDQELKTGKWKKRMGNLVTSKKVGIIGFGKIGQAVASLLLGLGLEVAYFDVEDKSTKLKCKKMPFKKLLTWADVITLHCGGVKGKPLIDKAEFALMKDGAWLINTARGEAVCEEALIEALDHKLGAAALDTFTEEPYRGKLLKKENVILTPHIGSYAKEARVEMEKQAVQNLLQALGK